LKEDLARPFGFDSMIGDSEPMRQVKALARKVAHSPASTVLITGESGTGKERIARLVHEESTRAAAPFIAVNCGAITEALLESELFGHRRGAFTGASADRPGLFEAANNGTLLLDEIGEVTPAMQVKLLRVLQEHEVRRVGENQSRKVNVRIIAATNRSLSQCVEEGSFREDLYYRLRVVELHVPSLRERRDDILPLARILLASAASRMDRAVSGLTPSAADLLLRHGWPGNVRELENAMERAVALAEGGRIDVEDLPPEVRGGVAATVADRHNVLPLREIEREYILAVLELNGGNQTRTARQLRIGTATLFRRLKSYGLTGKGGARRGKPTGGH
jgi:transcriptional regulator with PAS, ATPase and Fis domain